MPRPRGLPRTGGRQLGTPNKNTAALKEIAGAYTQGAIQRLASIMNNPRAPYAAQVAAAHELLDRGHGKAHATQDMNVTGEQRYVQVPESVSNFEWIAKRADGAVETLQGYLLKAEAAGNKDEAADIKAWIEYAKARPERQRDRDRGDLAQLKLPPKPAQPNGKSAPKLN
jgi:hypothetical protein